MKRVASYTACGLGLLAMCVEAVVPPQALTVALPARDGAAGVTPEWVLDAAPPPLLFGFSGLSWVGDSERLVYSFLDPREKQAAIESLDLRTGRRQRLAAGFNPKVSPDGRWIAYAVSAGEDSRLCIQDTKSGAVREIGHLSRTDQYSFRFAWSPDSRRIAVAHRPAFVRPWVRASAGSDDRATAVDFDAPAAMPEAAELRLHDIDGGTPRDILKVPGVFYNIEWYPEGNKLLYSLLQFSFENADRTSTTVLGQINIESGENIELQRFDRAIQSLSPHLSRDGRGIAMTLDFESVVGDVMPSVAVLPARGGGTHPPRQLTNDAKMSEARWSDDGQSIYAWRRYGAYSQLYKVDIATGKMTQLTHLAAELRAVAFGSRGRVAFLTADAHARQALRVARIDARGLLGPSRQVAEIVRPPDNVRLGEVREATWTAADGVQSRGVVFLPPQYQEGRRYPLVVDLHGGLMGSPVSIQGGALLYNTPLEFHMWAAKGYVVLLPEFRSSGALGADPQQRLRVGADPYGFHGDEQDILGGIDSLVASGLVDADRVAVLGVSGGASETNWLVARTRGRFRAAVSCDGFAEIYMMTVVASAAGGQPELARAHGGWPWEIPQRYLENSAIYHIRGATTPTLFLMGSTELSGADPTLSSQFLYTALKRQGVETRYVRYADEGHGFFRPANRRDSVMRAVAWIDRHMQR